MLYVHAGGIDQPLGLIRMDYSHTFPAPVLIVPHANWRGMYEQGTVVANQVCRDVWLPISEMVYMDSTGRRMVAPVATGPDGEELDTLQTRCIEIDFPGKAANMRHLLRQNSVAGPITWMGSLPQDAQDASGLMYRRNRFYDPKSGRFTQEDPIGLAGGVNSYGFAEGDPVSYGDPHGLSPCCKWIGSVFTAMGMTMDFLTGYGPSVRIFREGSVQVEQLKNAPGVQRARTMWDMTNSENVNSGRERSEPVIGYPAKFGLSGPFRAGLNPTRQFVGSFNVNIVPDVESGTIRITVINTTSIPSAFYHLPGLKGHERVEGADNGFANIRQIFTWSEKMNEGKRDPSEFNQ